MDEKAGILIRVSTTRQGERGVSVNTQRQDCSDYAERQGWQVVMVEEDHQTGTNFERAGFRRLVDAAKNGVIHKLIVYSLDRFGRGDMLSSLVELGTFEDAGCEIHSLKDGGRQEDSLIRDIRLAINKDFSRQLSDKTTRNMAYLAQKGHWVSCPPFGYATIDCPCGKGKILDPDKDSWAVPEIFTRFLGGDSMRDIVLWAASQGLKTKRGTPISHWSLSRTLTNPAYVGLVVWNRKGQGTFRSKGQRPESEIITSPGKHEALVAMDLWEGVQARLGQQKKFHTRPGRRQYPLAGIIYCGECGGHMYASTGSVKKKNGKVYHYPYYGCSRRNNRYDCNQPTIRSAFVDEHVWDEINRQIPSSEDRWDEIFREIRRRGQHAAEVQENFIPHLEKKSRDLQRKLSRLLDDDLTGAYPASVIDGKRQGLTDELAAIDSELQRLKAAQQGDQQVRRILMTGREFMPLAREANQQLLRLLLNRVVIRGKHVEFEWSAHALSILNEPDEVVGMARLGA